jgi:hypothetical protein
MATYAARLRNVNNGNQYAEIGKNGQIVIRDADTSVVSEVAQVNPGATTKSAANGDIPLTHAVVQITTGAASAYDLQDGFQGQMLTMVVTTDGGEGTVTPATSTGWATAVFTDDIDTLTVLFVNDVVGWVVIGGAGDGTNMVALTQ